MDDKHQNKENLIFGRPSRDIFVGIAFLLVVIVLGVSAYWAYYQFKTTPPYVDSIRYPVRGIDISSHNGEIDFNKVASQGYDFVFIKVSEGKNFNDRNFRKNYDNARRAGLKIGFYHFFRFDREGVDQGMNFARSIGSRKTDLGLVIDVEKDGNPSGIDKALIIERLTSMTDYLNLLGYRVMFYTNFEGYYEYIADNFEGYPLWICRFKENPINAEWTFWQYSHTGRVEGVPNEVDLDVFCGNRMEWENYLRGEIWPYSN